MGKQRIKDMTVGSPAKLLLAFMMPLIFGNLFQQVYNMVDTIVVGRYLGQHALAGVGSTGAVNFLVLGFSMGLCSGFAIPVAQKFGEKDYQGLRRYVGNMIWLGVGFALILTVSTTLLCRRILVWMRNPAETIDYAYNYIFWIFLGIPATMLYNLLSGLIRSLGDSRTPLLFLIFSSVLNVGLDLLFIVTFRMGVMGASVATVAAQLISGLLCLILIIRKYPILKLSAADLLPRRAYLQKLLSMGIPMGLQFSITAIGGTVLQTAVNELGTASMAAMTAGNKISLLFDCPLSAIGTAMATFAGQNLGAHRLDRVHKGFRVCMLIGGIYCIAIFALIACGGSPLSGIFLENPSEEIISMCEKFLLYNSSLYFLLLMVFLLRMTLQGLGYSFIVVLAGVLEMVARGGIALGLVPQLGFDAVCLANPAAWLFADVFLLPTYLIGVHRLEKQEKAGKLNV